MILLAGFFVRSQRLVMVVFCLVELYSCWFPLCYFCFSFICIDCVFAIRLSRPPVCLLNEM